MTIESAAFVSIAVDGKAYGHGVIVSLSGEAIERDKVLSRKHYGTSHVIPEEEAKFVYEKGCEQAVIGSRQMGKVEPSPEAAAYFAKMGCEVLLRPTPEASGLFNGPGARKVGLFHVTC